jgi:hypothetical protein
MSNLKKTTVKLGNEKELFCITESSHQYAYPLTGDRNLTTMNQNKNLELKNYLKNHHFEFGAKPPARSTKNSVMGNKM